MPVVISKKVQAYTDDLVRQLDRQSLSLLNKDGFDADAVGTLLAEARSHANTMRTNGEIAERDGKAARAKAFFNEAQVIEGAIKSATRIHVIESGVVNAC